MIIRVIFLLFLISSCDSITQKETIEDSEEEKIDQTIENEPLIINQVIGGQWLAQGNEGIVSNWLEFDTTSMTFSSWLDGEIKPSNPLGEFAIIQDSLLQLSNYQYRRPDTYGFDSISIDYLNLWSTGVNAGNLIYRRSLYTPPKKRIIFFHLSEAEFDSLVQIPDYEGLYEVSSDFGFYVSNVIDSLKNSTIRTDVITDRIVQLDTIQFDKFEYHGYGTVLIKNDSVLIEHGIMTDVGYFQLISEFFGVIY